MGSLPGLLFPYCELFALKNATLPVANLASDDVAIQKTKTLQHGVQHRDGG